MSRHQRRVSWYDDDTPLSFKKATNLYSLVNKEWTETAQIADDSTGISNFGLLAEDIEHEILKLLQTMQQEYLGTYHISHIFSLHNQDHAYVSQHKPK